MRESGFMDLLKALVTCSHARANAVEGKTFCPDCGQGVVFRWVVLKCVGCGQRRSACYRFRQVAPVDLCCRFCGDPSWEARVLVDPEYYQLRYALLQYEPDPEEAAGRPDWGYGVLVSLIARLWAWLDPSPTQSPPLLCPSSPLS